MKPVICVRHQENAPLGVIQQILEQERVPWRYHDCWTEPGPPDLTEASGLILLGGAMNADEVDGYPYLRGIRDVARRAVETGKPLLGICLGAQILSRALDGEVYRAPQRELGFIEVTSTGVDADVLDVFAPKSKVFQFHEDTCSLPEGAELLLTGRDVAVQAFRVGPKAYGVQFHFEVTTSEIEAWCDEVIDLEADWGLPKSVILDQARSELDQQQSAGREVTRRFLRLFK